MNSYQHLCLIRLSAIGDCIHAVAMVQAIQRHYPQTKITWIMGKIEAALLSDLPDVNVVVFDKKAGLKGYFHVWKQLRHIQFDAVLHLQSALRASLICVGLKSKKILGFDAQRSSDGQHFFTNTKVSSPASAHVLDGFMAFARAIGVNDLTPSWQIPISTTDKQWAQEQIDRPTLLISPAASKPFKNWTTAGYAAIADDAFERGLNVILCGGPSALEKNMADEILSLCNHKPISLIGKTTLKQLMALIQECHCVLAPDTGPTHMATAAGKPVIGLYAHHNPARTGPYFSQKYIVSVYEQCIKQETGKASHELPWRTRLKDPNAMQRIQIDNVKNALDLLLIDHPIDKTQSA